MNGHILVVEDQEDNRQILRDLLGSAGYELTEAENGEPALAAVAERHGQREAAHLADRLGDTLEQVGPVLDEPLAAVLAAGLLVFAFSFDDFVLSFFTTGEDLQPLPVRIWSAIRFGLDPTINAIGTPVGRSSSR